jgi:hypothetical protein
VSCYTTGSVCRKNGHHGSSSAASHQHQATCLDRPKRSQSTSGVSSSSMTSSSRALTTRNGAGTRLSCSMRSTQCSGRPSPGRQ